MLWEEVTEEVTTLKSKQGDLEAKKVSRVT